MQARFAFAAGMPNKLTKIDPHSGSHVKDLRGSGVYRSNGRGLSADSLEHAVGEHRGVRDRLMGSHWKGCDKTCRYDTYTY